MISNYTIRRERLFGIERENVLRAPKPNAPSSTRQQSSPASPPTLVGSAAPRTTRAPEMQCDVWAFRGSQGLVQDSNSAWPSTEFTVGLLVRMRSVATQQALIAADDGSQRSFSLASLADGALRFQVHSGATSTALTTATSYAAGRWRWITAQYESGALRLFVDRNDFSSASGPLSWNVPTTAPTVGWRDEFGFEDRLDGDVAWFGVWTRSLPRAQVRELHRSLRPPNYATARSVFGWPFPAARAFLPIVSLAGRSEPLLSPASIVG
jgi:hypothetical protein